MSSPVARYLGCRTALGGCAGCALHRDFWPRGLNPSLTPLGKPCAPVQAVAAQRAHLFAILTKVPTDCDQTQLWERVGVARLSPAPLPSRCCECSAPLSHQYYEKDGQLFCKKDYWARYGESCHGCSEHITKGLVMVSTPCPTRMSHLLCMCVSVRVRTGFPARDLSPIISLALLFTGSLIPPMPS